MTEEEARQKWCPQFASTMGNTPTTCIASTCMAWRWIQWRVYDPGEVVPPTDRTYGYCGLAGKP